MSSTREDYLNKVKAKLDEWNAEIGVLEARLDQVSSSGEEAWGELKSGLDLAWDALSDAVKSAKTKFDS